MRKILATHTFDEPFLSLAVLGRRGRPTALVANSYRGRTEHRFPPRARDGDTYPLAASILDRHDLDGELKTLARVLERLRDDA